MLDGFKRNHDVDRLIRKGNCPRIARYIAQIWSLIGLDSMDNGDGVDFHTHNRASDLRQIRRPIPFTRSHIQDVLTATIRPGEKITMQMLNFDLPSHRASQTLPIEIERLSCRFANKNLAHD